MNKYEFWQQLRKNKKLSQDKLAIKFGVTKQMISMFENGKSKSKPLQIKYLRFLSDDEKLIELSYML